VLMDGRKQVCVAPVPLTIAQRFQRWGKPSVRGSSPARDDRSATDKYGSAVPNGTSDFLLVETQR
jgi:hypothetical protein